MDYKIEKGYTLTEATYTSEDGNKKVTVKEGGNDVRYTALVGGNWSWASWKTHREDGPATIKNGVEKYYRNGMLHREDGPASFDKNGKPMYRLNGTKVSAYKVLGDSKEAFSHAIINEGKDFGTGKKILT